MIIPPYLKKNDRVAIVAPARKINQDEIKFAINAMQEWGLDVVLGDHLFDEVNQFAGKDELRAQDLQKAMDDDSIKAVFFARGGYGTVRLMEYLNFENFKKSPKWLIGYSDLTVIHNVCNQLGICSLHSQMPLNFKADWKSNPAIQKLKQVVFGENLNYEIGSHDLNKEGQCKGELVGGNLSVLYSLAGTKYDLDTGGKILFLEDLDEYLYHIDRMMMNLKLFGKLENLKGLIIGGMTDMNDNAIPFGKNAEEIIKEAVSEYSYPVCFDFPTGHIENNFPLIMGQNVELNVLSDKVTLDFL